MWGVCVLHSSGTRWGKAALARGLPPRQGSQGRWETGDETLAWNQPAQQGQDGLACLEKPSGGDFSWCAGTESEEQHPLAVYPLGFLQGIKGGLD